MGRRKGFPWTPDERQMREAGHALAQARRAERIPGHVHRGRCGRKCFAAMPPNDAHPDAVGGTD